jgi:hypothetical protein
MTGRLLVPVDAYMLLGRDGKLLMLRRAPDASYAAGPLCPPSGHVEAGETVSEAAIRETAKHSALAWIDPGDPPDDLVAYTWAGLRAWRAGAPHAIHFQQPGSPVRYHPGHEHELTLLERPAYP